jgi:hypothetical protein
MGEQIQFERARCVGICRSRAELWRRTAASYLADLLASGTDLSELAVVSGDDADA